jgi:hypothetical protein
VILSRAGGFDATRPTRESAVERRQAGPFGFDYQKRELCFGNSDSFLCGASR